MTDDPNATFNADDEVVAAYLADDLDADAAAAFERRLEREPALVARLDALADALVSLGGHDESVLPEGFDARLSERLAAERAPNVTSLSEQRRRRDRGRVWLGVGTAAAVLAAGAVMAGNMMQGVNDSVSGVAAESAEGGSEAASAPQEQRLLSGPVIVDRQVAVSGEDDLRQRYESLPEAEELLGTSLDDAAVLADRDFAATDEQYSTDDELETTALESGDAAAGSGSGGGGGGAGAGAEGASGEQSAEEPAAGQAAETGGSAAPSKPPASATSKSAARAAKRLDETTVQRCLGVITEGATATLVPVRIESMRYSGTNAISYVFVTAAPQSQQLDRVEVWVVRRQDCATIVFQQR